MADLVLGQSLRQLLDERSEVGVVGEWQYGALERSDEGRESEVGTLLVAVSHAEVVLEERVHDTADAEGGFDDVGNDFLKSLKDLMSYFDLEQRVSNHRLKRVLSSTHKTFYNFLFYIES